MKKKLYLSDEQISELNILLKKETAEKQNLLNKYKQISIFNILIYHFVDFTILFIFYLFIFF